MQQVSSFHSRHPNPLQWVWRFWSVPWLPFKRKVSIWVSIVASCTYFTLPLSTLSPGLIVILSMPYLTVIWAHYVLWKCLLQCSLITVNILSYTLSVQKKHCFYLSIAVWRVYTYSQNTYYGTSNWQEYAFCLLSSEYRTHTLLNTYSSSTSL